MQSMQLTIVNRGIINAFDNRQSNDRQQSSIANLQS